MKTRKVGSLRLKHHQSVLQLREQGMRWMRKAVAATNNAHALFALADKRERDAQKLVEDFYLKQAREAADAGHATPEDVRTAFELGHLGKGKS